MKKKLIIIGLVLVVLLGGGWALYHHFKNGNHPAAAPGSHSTPTNPTAADAVTIDNYAFSPADVTVKVGTAVTWTNKDFLGYTVSEDDGKAGPSSGLIDPNQTYTYKYAKAGLFHYHDSLDPQAQGTVTVTP